MMNAVFDNELVLPIKEKLRCKGVDVSTLAPPRPYGAAQRSLDEFMQPHPTS